jgi:hypothetical protein
MAEAVHEYAQPGGAVRRSDALLSAEAEVAVQPSECPAGYLSASQAALPRAGRGRGRWGSGEDPASVASLTTCAPEGASVTWPRGLTLVRASSEATTGGVARIEAVQHGSTATHPDAGGLAGTREDDDLHRCTRVDVLPAAGMQEVWGSSPLSSTPVQMVNFEH